MKTIHRFALSLVTLAVVAGCSTTPVSNVRLDQAREDFRTVQGDPRSQSQAPAELRQAADALNAANTAQNNREDLAQVNHLAYVASQRAAIVRETVNFKTAELSVANAGAARTSAQLQARTQEADAAQRAAAEAQRAAADAQRMASTARTDTAQAQQQAAMAQERNRMLEARLAELNAKQTPRGTVITLGDVLFAVDRSSLQPNGTRMVSQLAEVLKADPQRTVLVEGFTDSTGADAYNQTLSTERADAVRVALLGQGIASTRVTARGYGKTSPVASNDTAAGRQMNRRVEIVLSNDSGQIQAR
jgi:outer membrane protein OmpA-like peptidoglycan-associated protein